MVCACWYLILLLSLAWVLLDWTVEFSLALEFLDNHGVMGLFSVLALDCRQILDPGEMVSGNFPEHRNALINNGGIHGKP